jgi:hypothetical protein
MRKILFCLIAVGFVSSLVFSQVIVSELVGNVEIFKESTNNWLPAKKGDILQKGDKIKTSEKGSAKLVFIDGSQIWVKENTEISVSLLTDTQISVELLNGKVYSKIVPLKSGNKFVIKTPDSIVSGGGSELALTVNEVGTNLFLISGKVEFENIISGIIVDVNDRQSSSSNKNGDIVSAKPLTAEDVKLINELKPEEYGKLTEEILKEELKTGKQKTTKEEQTAKEEQIEEEIIQVGPLAELKKQLQDFVEDVKLDVGIVKNIVHEVKENDFSVGRTLKDIHGNIVRVDQYFTRPDNKTIELLNLTKRTEYVYNGKFDYKGTNTNRIDSIDMKIVFNKELPEQVSDWSNFLKNEENSSDPNKLKISDLNLKLSNGTDTIEWKNYREVPSEEDESSKNVKLDLYINDKQVDTEKGDYDKSNFPDVVEQSGDDTDLLWNTKIEPIWFVGTTDPKKPDIYLRTEFYGINNNGNLLSENFMENVSDPISIFNEIAIQGIISCKKADSTGRISDKDYFSKSNIDLVFTPDIIVAGTEKLGMALVFNK